MQTAGRLIDTPRPHPYSFHGMRLCALVLALSVLAGCQRTSSPGGAREDFVTVAHGRYVNRWERRFNPFDSDPLWPARAGIYEPLIIFNTMTAECVPWLQTLFAEHAPALPLFPGPAWGEFNTTRFTGFPSAERPYARLAPAQDPERLLVLLELRPR